MIRIRIAGAEKTHTRTCGIDHRLATADFPIRSRAQVEQELIQPSTSTSGKQRESTRAFAG
jgi:hypothetical protein